MSDEELAGEVDRCTKALNDAIVRAMHEHVRVDVSTRQLSDLLPYRLVVTRCYRPLNGAPST